MDIYVSVVVPAYNAEGTIERCLQSLINQTLSEIQIVVVDDGSADRTGNILDEWKFRYPEKLTVIHQENSGVWRARKNGIEAAEGIYTGFCDADDFVSAEMYESLYRRAVESGAQISVCAYQRYQDDAPRGKAEMSSFGNRVMAVSEETMGELAVVNTALWNKIFRTKVLRRGIEFAAPPKIAEDMMLFLSTIPYVKRIAFVEKPMYSYVIYEESAMNTIKDSDADRTMEAMLRVKEFMPGKYEELTAVMAFIHIGISLPIGLIAGSWAETGLNIKKFQNYLTYNFPKWKKCSYLKLGYIFKHNLSLIKPYIVQKIYVLHLFGLFARMYSVVVNRLKVNIKW